MPPHGAHLQEPWVPPQVFISALQALSSQALEEAESLGVLLSSQLCEQRALSVYQVPGMVGFTQE